MAIEFSYPEQDVLLSVQKPPFSPDDVKALQMEIAKSLKNQKRLFVISDMREVELTFSEIVAGMSQSMDSSTGYRAGDDGIELIMVTDKKTNKQLVDYYKQEQYGQLDMALFSTLEEAKAFIASRR